MSPRGIKPGRLLELLNVCRHIVNSFGYYIASGQSELRRMRVGIVSVASSFKEGAVRKWKIERRK